MPQRSCHAGHRRVPCTCMLEQDTSQHTYQALQTLHARLLVSQDNP